MYVPTFSAIPEDLFIALEHSVLQNIIEKFPVSFFMTFLCGRNSFKCGRDVFKSFFLCCFGERWIKIAPFFMFPSAAAKRLSFVVSVLPAGYDAVISTIPPSRNLKNLLACCCSCNAVARKIPEICSNPSSFATLAANSYLFLACDSPANAFSRFCSVFVPFKLFPCQLTLMNLISSI